MKMLHLASEVACDYFSQISIYSNGFKVACSSEAGQRRACGQDWMWIEHEQDMDREDMDGTWTGRGQTDSQLFGWICYSI